MVERTLRMCEAPGSIPGISKENFEFYWLKICKDGGFAILVLVRGKEQGDVAQW